MAFWRLFLAEKVCFEPVFGVKMQKNALFLNFFAKLFGQFKKKHYLCTRFRKMRGEILKNAEVLCKLSESMLLQLNEAKTLDFSGGKGGNSSVGRARPCQGRGRGFESRFPLQKEKLNVQNSGSAFFS